MDEGSADDGAHVWAQVGAVLTLFGFVFAVAVFVIPTNTGQQRIVLALVSGCLSLLLWRSIDAVRARMLDIWVLILVLALVGTLVLFSAMLVRERDATIAALRDAKPTRTSDGLPTSTTNPATASPSSSAGASPTATEVTSPGTTSPVPPPADPPIVNGTNKVEANGTITLPLDDGLGRGLMLECWDTSGCGFDPDVVAHSTGLGGGNGTDMALVSRPASYARCTRPLNWVTTIAWPQLPQGAVLCLRKNDGLRGALVIDAVPDLHAQNASVTVTGVLWATVSR